jgi:hypothetical protein
MQKLIYTFLALIFIWCSGNAQLTTLWEKSAAAGTKPAWEAGSFTRGLSYGYVNGQHLLFVVNRSNAAKNIIYYNAVTGDSLGMLDTTGIEGGLYTINDIEVSTDGKIFLCNMTTDASNAAHPFKVYRYDSLTALPVTAVSFGSEVVRLGDKFTVTGSTADNSVTIWAANNLASAGPGNLYKFTTTDNGVTFTAVPIAIQTGSSPAAGPLPDGSFYFNFHGTAPLKYTAAGTLIGGVPSAVVSTSGSAVKFMNSLAGDEFIAANDVLTANNNGKIVRVPNGAPAAATLLAATPLLGSNNAGGLGDISVQKINMFEFNVYVLSTNNGFGAYKVKITPPPLAGDYYIGAPGSGPSGSNPHFANLREAFYVLGEAEFTGDCTFYITSDITETYPSGDYGLGLAINPSPHIVTFKPYTGVQPVITLPYLTDGTSGPSGALIFGVPTKGNIAWDSMKTTKNIVIDGSNTAGGTTRDLTITNLTTSHRNAIPLTIVGDVSNMVVKNTNIYYKAQGVSTSGNLFAGAIMLRSRNYLSQDWVPRDIVFENNHINANFPGVVQSVQAYGTYQTGTPLPNDYPYNITLKNNVIEGKRRAVSLYIAGSHNIEGNEIILNQDIAGNISNEAIYGVNVDSGSVINIFNNKISKVSSITNAAASGQTAISIETHGTYNVYNNMFYGFELTAANPIAFVRAVKNSSANATLNFYFNTILMDNLADIGTGTVTYQGLFLTNGINNVKNNIIVNAETDFASYIIYRSGTSGTLVSNYNDLYPVSATNGYVGYWNDASAQTLAAWQTASGQDANSVSKEVFFVSSTDLHLTGTSNGDHDLIATPIAGITHDIDGDLRHAMVPYKGADEAPIVLPVEMVSFKADVVDGSVMLTWITATEINNKGFEVERKSTGDFTTVGFVNGRGNSLEPVSYSFTDKVEPGKYSYRLRQVDFNGQASYSEIIEVDMVVPMAFSLSQNYPNPFNPVTTINFQVAEPVNVTLTIYDALGAEAAILINNQYTEPGNHSVRFNASNLASGTYIYRITAGSYVETKKMILMK